MISPGQWVQYNVAAQSPRSALPTAAEKSIGLVRQSFSAFGGPFYQVVWNPGSAKPETGLYTDRELCALTQQEATARQQQLATGEDISSSDTPGSQYPQRNIPVQAAPAFYQQTGMETL
jgi:hypothetical protein